ncbi:MAG TPA: acyltransferase [Bacteroidia bacterium]|jgi:peptidoglycan/LPS O-acetylase OafA/YrhL
MRLKVFDVINDPRRISSIDVFRCIAIIAVVAYHFNAFLPYGYIGVDLFFVISGLLVGGILTREFVKGTKTNPVKFIFQRGLKIWPSYYAFLIFGNMASAIIYQNSGGHTIPLNDMWRYLFFYQNYTGAPYHWSFDHVWSLCVEEHFYILLPVLFVIVQAFNKDRNNLRLLFICVILTIAAGIAFKFLSYNMGKDTFSATHNRLDALAWGVLLNLLITKYGHRLKNAKIVLSSLTAGSALFLAALLAHIYSDSEAFEKAGFHSLLPLSFFLVLLGVYYFDLSRLKILRFIAYYSYNWYLWHTIFVCLVTDKFGRTIPGFLVYLVTTFTAAMLSTIIIEETFLAKRDRLLKKLFT